MARASKYGQIEIPGIPDDEPVFIIRAKDKISIAAIEEYECLRETYTSEAPSQEWTDSLDAVLQSFSDWQAGHIKLVKLPD